MRYQTPSPIRVYHVEDQPMLREVLKSLIELEQDVELVGSAGDAEIALHELRDLDVDVVLMDIRLPGIDGIEATRFLRESRPDVAVVMLTSYEVEFIGPALEAGAIGYVIKSCTRKQLMQAVRDACASATPIG